MQAQEIAAIVAVVLPVVLAVARYVWQLGSVQAWMKKSHHALMIQSIVDTAINATEQLAKKVDPKLTSADKKAKAMEFAKATATKMGVPAKLIDDAVISGFIESALSKVDWGK